MRIGRRSCPSWGGAGGWQLLLPLAIYLLLLGPPLLLAEDAAAVRKPRIYIYEMDEKYHNHSRFQAQISAASCFYSLDALFPEQLRASPHWTNSSEEADYFYVDAWMYWPWQNMDEIVQVLRSKGPWFDRNGGKDHIFVITADPGRCQFPHEATKDSIFIQHFGMLDKVTTQPCDLMKTWGAACDRTLTTSLASIKGGLRGCHIPGQDIVVPPSPYEFYAEGDKANQPPWLPESRLGGLERKIKLYYAGKIDLHKGEKHEFTEPWSDAHYSFGARQTAFRQWRGVHGFKLQTSHAQGNYWRDVASSIFCLATNGWGWGGRMKVAVTRGCIPLIVADGTKVEWEENLPIQDYALRVPTWMLHKLPQIIDAAIETGKVAKMQQRLECAWRMHWWRRPHGRAFEVVMCELKRRLLGHSAGHIKVDWDKCEIFCGDDKPVPLKLEFNNV